MKDTYEYIDLHPGDSLKIRPEIKEFLLGCCSCGAIHKIKIKREKKNIILQFFEDKK